MRARERERARDGKQERARDGDGDRPRSRDKKATAHARARPGVSMETHGHQGNQGQHRRCLHAHTRVPPAAHLCTDVVIRRTAALFCGIQQQQRSCLARVVVPRHGKAVPSGVATPRRWLVAGFAVVVLATVFGEGGGRSLRKQRERGVSGRGGSERVERQRELESGAVEWCSVALRVGRSVAHSFICHLRCSICFVSTQMNESAKRVRDRQGAPKRVGFSYPAPVYERTCISTSSSSSVPTVPPGPRGTMVMDPMVGSLLRVYWVALHRRTEAK
jgi:hypothetical protein